MDFLGTIADIFGILVDFTGILVHFPDIPENFTGIPVNLPGVQVNFPGIQLDFFTNSVDCPVMQGYFPSTSVNSSGISNEFPWYSSGYP